MISVIPMEGNTFRAFGWVQDPSSLRSLCNVVGVFDETSEVHKALRDHIIPTLVEERDGREALGKELDKRPLRLEYIKLVGTSFTPRSASRCNGIIQATVKGQLRDFIGDWPADNFVRWAHAFGFIQYHYVEDAFSITDAGKELVAARDFGRHPFPTSEKSEELSAGEEEVLTKAILAYPPAVRILTLLSKTEETHLSKFEIGKNLGFIGEGGFTSLPQSIYLRALAATEDTKEKNKMRTDWDGSSDKYARMISKWLEKLGLVEQEPKYYEIPTSNGIKQEMIGQSYRITAKGYGCLNRIHGKSKHKRISKNVCFEMLATKGGDREYLRTRRAYILKCLSEAKDSKSLREISEYLKAAGIEASTDTIQDDIAGIINIGIQIVNNQDKFSLDDQINDFVIPIAKEIQPSSMEEIKDRIRKKLTHLSHEHLSLLDLAYDSKQNRLFEMKTLELLTEECGFEGLHLGGIRKPDGIIYTTGLQNNYGVIVDTKAYSGGYNLPISQADEMERYIGENQTRDPLINSNLWWDNFAPEVNEFFFLFISGHFKGGYEAQLERVSMNKQVQGGVISVENLLYCAELIKRGQIQKTELPQLLFQNKEAIFELLSS